MEQELQFKEAIICHMSSKERKYIDEITELKQKLRERDTALEQRSQEATALRGELAELREKYEELQRNNGGLAEGMNTVQTGHPETQRRAEAVGELGVLERAGPVVENGRSLETLNGTGNNGTAGASEMEEEVMAPSLLQIYRERYADPPSPLEYGGGMMGAFFKIFVDIASLENCGGNINNNVDECDPAADTQEDSEGSREEEREVEEQNTAGPSNTCIQSDDNQFELTPSVRNSKRKYQETESEEETDG